MNPDDVAGLIASTLDGVYDDGLGVYVGASVTGRRPAAVVALRLTVPDDDLVGGVERFTITIREADDEP